MLVRCSTAVLSLLLVACASSPEGGAAPAPDEPAPAAPLAALSVREWMPFSGGIAVLGRVMRGVLRAGSEAELLGFGPARPVTIAALSINGAPVAEAPEGGDAAALLMGVELKDVRIGQVVATPRGALQAATQYTVDATFARDDENPERNTPLISPAAADLAFGSGVLKGELTLASAGAPIEYATKTRMLYTLEQSLVLMPGATMTFWWGGVPLGELTIIAAVPAR